MWVCPTHKILVFLPNPEWEETHNKLHYILIFTLRSNICSVVTPPSNVLLIYWGAMKVGRGKFGEGSQILPFIE